MRIAKSCMICNQEVGLYNCRLCGRLICMNHYDKTKGICTDCFTSISKVTGKA